MSGQAAPFALIDTAGIGSLAAMRLAALLVVAALAFGVLWLAGDQPYRHGGDGKG